MKAGFVFSVLLAEVEEVGEAFRKYREESRRE